MTRSFWRHTLPPAVLRRIASLVTIAAVSVTIAGAGAAFCQGVPSPQAVGSEATPAGIDLEASYRPLGQQLERLSAATRHPHTTTDRVSGKQLFIAVSGESAEAVREQMAQTLSDLDWVFFWQQERNQAGTGARSPGPFRLDCRPRTDAERQEALIARGMGRVNRLREFLDLPPAEFEKAVLANLEQMQDLRTPHFRARAELLAGLPDDVLRQALAGQPTSIPVSALPPHLASKAREAMANSGDGASEFATNGFVAVEHSRLPDGSYTVRVGLYTDPNLMRVYSALGESKLDPDQVREGQGERARRMRQAEREREVSAVMERERLVTILRNTPLRDGETPPAAYLRELVRQTGLTLLARFPAPSSGDKTAEDARLRRRLPTSITRASVAEALDRICNTYGCEWRLDGRIVRVTPTEDFHRLTAKNLR